MEQKDLNKTKGNLKKMFIILPGLALVFFFIMFIAVKFNVSDLQLMLMVSSVFVVCGIVLFINRVIIRKEAFNWLKFFGYFIVLSVVLPLIMITSLSFLRSAELFSASFICILIAFYIFALTLRFVYCSPKTSKETRLALLFSLILTTFFIFFTRPELLFKR